jgi:hypothetical protein
MVERQETLPMRRRRLLLGVGPPALLGVAGLALFLWLMTPTPGVTWENFRRLRVGMSAREAKALLGEGYEELKRPNTTDRFWWGEDVVISLSFDVDRLWAGHAFPPDFITRHVEYIRPHESFLDRIRRLLHW